MTGRKILQTTGEINAGLWKEYMDISALAQGIYVYQFRFGHKSISGRFEKIE